MFTIYGFDLRTSKFLVCIRGLFAVLIFFGGCAAVQAHEVVPAIFTLSLQEDGSFTIQSRLNMEALVAEIDPELSDTNESPNAPQYDALRLAEPEELRRQIIDFSAAWLSGIEIVASSVDGEQRVPLEYLSVDVPGVGNPAIQRLSIVTVRGEMPLGSTSFTWRYDPFYGESAIRVGVGDTAIQAQFLQSGELSKPFPLGDALVPLSRSEVAVDYVVLGFEHILPKGLDHILFVLGIFLLSLSWRPLLLQVTAFTIAHTITLALSLYGVIALSPAIVEPLIALSIVYVAIENVLTKELKPWRVWVVFAFGLLHGMGFAGVLTELGLPEGEFVTALIAFNVGVELGQLAVIAAAFLLVGVWFRNKPWYRSRIVIPCSLGIAATGLWWTIERVFF